MKADIMPLRMQVMALLFAGISGSNQTRLADMGRLWKQYETILVC